MTLEQECLLSYYKEIAAIDGSHNVTLVQHTESGQVFVKKVLTLFNADIYKYLHKQHIDNTPRIFEIIEDDNELILIEEYINGVTLRDIIDKNGHLPAEQAVSYTIQLCKILNQLHNGPRTIIHRDIKPSNIIITSDGILKLLDMNASKYYKEGLKRDTSLIGTAGYAAPEQYGFGASDVRTDIYAVGIILNEMITGRLPEEGKASGEVGRIIDKCTKLNASDRYSSVAELQNSLENLQAGTNISSKDKWYIPAGFRTGKNWVKVLAAIGYALLLAFSLSMKLNVDSDAALWANRISCFMVFYLIINCTVFWLFSGKNVIKAFWKRLITLMVSNILIIMIIVALMNIIISLITGVSL